MSFSLLPKHIAEDVTQLTPQLLHSLNIRLLMLDFDNTIVPYTTDIPSPLMEQWLMDAAEWGIPVCVVSNSKNDRVRRFCRHYGIDCITHARKPFTKGIRECLGRFRVPASEAAMVGDQIFTDTLGGNCAGATSILVKPIHNHNFWLKARHVLEKPFIYLTKNRRIST